MSVAPDWIESYLDYTAAQESPEVFHRWAGIAIIGAVLNRRVFLIRRSDEGSEFYPDFPGQISPIFVAGSGKARKSTAINIAKQMMKDAGVTIYDGKITPERLLAKLAGMPGKQAVLCTVASELSAFLGKQSYNDGLIDILIKLADCDSHPYETQKKTYDLSNSNVCFTLFGGSTPVGLSKAIPPQAQDHGFLSRYIWVYSERSGKIEPLANDLADIDPVKVRRAVERRNALVIRLRGMRQLNGEFQWGKARDWYMDRYKAFMQTTASDGEGWPARKWNHIPRVAMVLNIARGATDLTFAESDLFQAERLINDVEIDMPKCFAFIGRHVNSEQQAKILGVLRGQGFVKDEIMFGKIMVYFRDLVELRRQLELLKSSGIIGDMKVKNVTYWKLLKEPI